MVGVRLEPVGDQWVAWSPRSGETHLLNDEGAAVLEAASVLGECGLIEVCAWLGQDLEADPTSLEEPVAMAWVPLIMAGLIDLAA